MVTPRAPRTNPKEIMEIDLLRDVFEQKSLTNQIKQLVLLQEALARSGG